MMNVTRAERSVISDWWWTVDRFMLALLAILMTYGVLLVAAASPSVAVRIGVADTHFIVRHLTMLLPAIGIMLGVSMLPVKWVRRVGSFVFLGGVLIMMVIPFVGMEIKGAQRWLHIFGLSIQPSEFVKPAFAIMVAWLLGQAKEKPDFPGNIVAGGIYFLVVGLLMLQPDLGMTVVLTCMFGAQIFVAGLPIRYLVIALALGLLGLFIAYHTFDHVQSRFDRFFNPESEGNYQVDQSMSAFRNGGFLGTGPGQGTVKQQIPDSHADFIFAVSGEELGFLFTLPLIGFFFLIIYRGFEHLMTAENMFVVLACTGILSMFGLQAVVHMGSAMHLLPTKGMTLPFVSYGGTSVLAMGFSFGVILALTRRQGRFAVVRGLSRGRGLFGLGRDKSAASTHEGE